jgi:hypothetical protein
MLGNFLRGKLRHSNFSVLVPSISLFFYVNFLSSSINSSVSVGGKYIIEVDVRCDSGIAVSICCQNRSSHESPEFSRSEMDVCRFTRFDCLFSRSLSPPPTPHSQHLFLLGCDCAVKSQVLHMRCGIQLLFWHC